MECLLGIALVLLASGFVFRSSPEVRHAPVQTSPAYYPVLGALVVALLVVFGSAVLPGIHWDQLALWLRGAL